MREYNKIETIYERDINGTKKLIEGKYRNETVEYLANNEWEFTEKIDGTNIRIYWDGHKITFGGRTDRASIPSHLVNKLNELFLNEETEQLFEQKFGEMEVTLFGEGYGTKIQAVGSDYRSDVGFILFDVLIGENYQSRESVEDIAKAFALEIVPIVLRGTIQEAVDFIKTNPNSTIGKAKMEGVVGRPKVELKDRCGHRLIVKIKCRDFEV
jgi:hypothetical protein